MALKLLIYLTTSNVPVSHYSSRKLTKKACGLGMRLRIKVFNYRQKLRDKSPRKEEVEEILSKSHIVCLQRESVSEARMDVFQAMT